VANKRRANRTGGNVKEVRTYPAKLHRVVDGDTVYLEVDLGFRVFGAFEFRLYGINCPEMNTPEGKAAKRFTMEWFTQSNIQGEVMVESQKDPEKYGRWLGLILPTESVNGESLNAALVATGHAVTYFP
jgi:micrococcal nuclease